MTKMDNIIISQPIVTSHMDYSDPYCADSLLCESVSLYGVNDIDAMLDSIDCTVMETISIAKLMGSEITIKY